MGLAVNIDHSAQAERLSCGLEDQRWKNDRISNHALCVGLPLCGRDVYQLSWASDVDLALKGHGAILVVYVQVRRHHPDVTVLRSMPRQSYTRTEQHAHHKAEQNARVHAPWSRNILRFVGGQQRLDLLTRRQIRHCSTVGARGRKKRITEVHGTTRRLASSDRSCVECLDLMHLLTLDDDATTLISRFCSVDIQ